MALLKMIFGPFAGSVIAAVVICITLFLVFRLNLFDETTTIQHVELLPDTSHIHPEDEIIREEDENSPPIPLSVNFHFTRKCNKTCVFCFHTEKTSYVENIEKMQRGLRLLKEAGMKKINFAGGEPFLYPKLLAQLCRYCKEDLELESVSIISNGSLIKKRWLEENRKYIDVLGISCDSVNRRLLKLH